MHGKTLNFKIINPRNVKIKTIIIIILTPDSEQKSRGSTRVKKKIQNNIVLTNFFLKKQNHRVFRLGFYPMLTKSKVNLGFDRVKSSQSFHYFS
jgi:hypothetical protein